MATLTTVSGKLGKWQRVKFTPAEARRVLEEQGYDANRRISSSWVEYLARQMEQGFWKSNGEPLIFSDTGKLLDGQHRLSAVVRSGKTRVFDVRGMVNEEAYATLDQGRGRTGAQVFAGIGVKNSACAAAICRQVYNWESHGTPFVGRRVSPDELRVVLELYPEDAEQAAYQGQRVRTAGIPVENSVAGFCFFLFSQVSRRKAGAFYDTLVDGVASSKGDAALALRNRLYREAVSTTRRRLPKRALFALFIKAWNYYHAGKEVKTLALKLDGDGGFKIPPIRGAGKGQCRRGSGRPE